MRTLMWCAIGLVVLAGATPAPAADPQLLAPIRTFIDSFNKGDAAAAAATHSATADLAIVDEIPPYLWTGAQALQNWSAALDADAKKNGITGPSVTIGSPTRAESDGRRAYVVVPAVYSFTQNGKGMGEKAQVTFVLEKGAAGWLIHAWTWTGPKPSPASPSSPSSPGPTKP